MVCQGTHILERYRWNILKICQINGFMLELIDSCVRPLFGEFCLSKKFLSCTVSIFWHATHLLLRAELASIPQMKEEMQGFHMTQIAEIFLGKIAL